MGPADTLEVTIFDIAGRVVHSGRLPSQPTGQAPDGRYFHDFQWTGDRASGLYFAVIDGIREGDRVRGRAKFALIR